MDKMQAVRDIKTKLKGKPTIIGLHRAHHPLSCSDDALTVEI